MTKPEIGLDDASRRGVAAILNRLLADEYLLCTKTRNFHWNVSGPLFSELHGFFERQYEELDSLIDEVAERVRALGETPIASLAQFLEHTRLKESAGPKPSPDMIGELLADHEAIIRQLRRDIDQTDNEYHDSGNQDMLTGWMEQHEKMAWMLRSMLE